MSERRIDEPPLPFRGCPDRVAIPTKRVLGLPVPLEVANVAGLQVNRLAVKCTEDRNACVRTLFSLSDGLSDEEHAKRCANDTKPTMLHDLSFRHESGGHAPRIRLGP